VSLNDRDALAVLHAALDPDDGNGLIGRFYTRWFSFEASPRDLFPPDMAAQRVAFAQALTWIYGELVAQRSEEPVAFLAQLGRDHRKYGVLPQHYETLGQALYATLRDAVADAWTDGVDAAARQSLNLITGVMSGAADAEQGPAWWDSTVVEHLRVSRDLAVVRLQLDSPMPYHAGQYVNVAVPQCPRRWRYLTPAIPPDDTGAVEFHVRAVSGGLVSNAIVNETQPGDRWRLSNPHRCARSSWTSPVGAKTRAYTCFSAAATRVSCTTCKRYGRSRRTIHGWRLHPSPNSVVIRRGPRTIPT
jgi:hemoglobin-like flavoprotein